MQLFTTTERHSVPHRKTKVHHQLKKEFCGQVYVYKTLELTHTHAQAHAPTRSHAHTAVKPELVNIFQASVLFVVTPVIIGLH